MTTTPFYVTFGQQYAYKTHPTFPPAHPDGWVTILAEDDLAARQIAVSWFGTAWCDLYEDEPDRALFPLGELHRISYDRARATQNAAIERIGTADAEFLRAVLGEIAQSHEPDPGWEGPPTGTCTTCGGTGLVYSRGEDGHEFGPGTCCCDHNHCAKCFTCCDPETGDLRCPELLLIAGEVAVQAVQS